ncbi:sugar ABC transporter ATP-binding protein [Mesorhizobium sp.]|uniref:sugar ABC transporter ATP-binding protein n=1 Tax=Mesorhizobium sp. TaxID=1871066 RepID=UPI000FE34FD5|nr:sugar ABC transporter ATP-binding protein [Mesorhizobium sp.]RWH72962.1 MAG: sugar ABC transporter ATP-binding protein [Mesorhizobium sp.]RWL34680.1 MAG: sugar ABC transporter ATP-binding protein [Mesorhizobium sp.]RWL36093.1 MAG: sugar ABC transporter ATP-binding protein [Mesorhizobium sp.]RWL41504.1 MAG: sugar ABC transporter ATP-binding protein [Mesorhizobium sp.]RWL61134.1 MAG: sugar ABC transporter ATP-binding protein [Mesorhizobium sp.]
MQQNENTTSRSATGQKSILRIEKGTKAYGGINAIENVDFDVRPGEIHALLGENGAGKSTLSKIIAGAVKLTSGKYLLDGQEMTMSDPRDALRVGVAMVYQETSLVPTMTVAQNLVLGRESAIISYRQIAEQAQKALAGLHFDVDPLAVVDTLGTAKRQMVEIARAMQLNARIIIFDEPTASLTPEETRHFFRLMRQLRQRGIGVVFISHALEEALQLADRITILRDGRLVTTSAAADLDRNQIIRLMVGRDLKDSNYARHPAGTPSQERPGGERLLEVKNVSMGMMVEDMSFSVVAGEVLGIAGLVGSGRSEIAKIVCGALKRDRVNGGSISFRGRPIRYRVPRQAIRDGIAYITEDRKLNGFFDATTIDDNIYLSFLAGPHGGRVFYSRAQRRRVSDRMVSALSISALKRASKVGELSGGNQQKVVVAKALVQEPLVLFFDEPTRGVDVGAIPQIHAAIRELASEGKGVVVISSYLPEILAISDRILVARGGRIVQEFDAADATEDKILSAAVH